MISPQSEAPNRWACKPIVQPVHAIGVPMSGTRIDRMSIKLSRCERVNRPHTQCLARPLQLVTLLIDKFTTRRADHRNTVWSLIRSDMSIAIDCTEMLRTSTPVRMYPL